MRARLTDLLRVFESPEGGDSENHSLRRRVRTLMSKGQTEKAVRLLIAASNDRPDDWYPTYLLGFVHSNTGDFQKADEAYEKALALAPHNPQLKALVAQFHIGAGKPESAVEPLQEAVNEWPKSSEAHSNLGMAYLKLGELDKAEREFQVARQLSDYNPDAREGLAQIYYLTERETMVELLLRNYLAGAPKLASSHAMLADFLLDELGDCRQAIEHYENALRLTVTENKPQWFRQYFSTAEYPWAIMGGYVRALTDCGHERAAIDAARMEPGNGHLEAFEAMLLEDAGEFDRAKAKIELAIEKDPTADQWFSQLARLHLATADLKGAEAAFRKALTISQERGATDPWHRAGLTVCLEAQGHLGEIDSIRVEVRQDELHRFLASLGYHYALIGEWDKAIEAYEQVRKDEPSDHRSARYLAKALMELSQHDRAIEILQDLLGAQPANPNNYLLLSKAHEAAGDHRSAVDVLKAAAAEGRFTRPHKRIAADAIERLSANQAAS